MPSRSKSQQKLMGAALGGAKFPAAKKIRASMSSSQIEDFAATKRKGLPEHVKSAPHPHRNLGSHLHKAKGKPDTQSAAYDWKKRK